MSNSETVTLKLTSAIVLGGTVRPAGDLVEVSDAEARNLLDRGKAELATEDNVKPAKKNDAEPTEAELQQLAAEAAARARVLKDEGMTEADFDALSAAKKKALLKAAADAIAKDGAQ